ncbi:MAG: PAS domain-containing protein, partial [Methanospirillum sp.]|nr:PAS domain-containing protein [Methanospirillum sp.]
MRLYTKTILIVALTFFAVMIILLVSFEFTVMNTFSSLEQEYMEKDLLRAEHVINEEITRVRQVATDLAIWDNTYQFAKTKDPAYISANLAPSTFETSRIQGIIIQDTKNRIIIGRQFNKTSGQFTTVSPDLVRAVTNVTSSGNTVNKAGLLSWNDSAWIFASEEILTTRRNGPSPGTLTVITPLDNTIFSSISNILLQNVTAGSVYPDSSPEESGLAFLSTGENNIVSQKILTDISGDPLLVLRVEGSRDFSKSGIYSRDFLFFSLLLLMVCFLGVAITLINLIIISPLSELNKELNIVGKTGSLSSRISVNRSDEIGELTETINRMLDQLEHSIEQRHTTEQRLSRLIALAEEGICLISPDKRIWFANPKMAAIFGSTPHTLTGSEITALLDPEPPKDTIDLLFTDQPVHKEYHTRKKDGTDLYIRIIAAPYPLDSGQEGHICVVSDITTIKENEKALLLSNNKLSLMGSMTRHDIVNQLTTIRGMLALVHRKTNDDIILNLIQTAEEAADRVNKHIEFSKEYQKAGIQAPVWQNLRTTWSLAYAMTKKKGLTFTFEGENYEVYADQLLQKVFYNLIDNSLKHGKNVFYITVKTEKRGN